MGPSSHPSQASPHAVTSPLQFHGGLAGALTPFVVFLSGVAVLALQGAPDEKGFWPVLLVALTVGLVLARDRARYADAMLDGMSQRVVMIMICAWLFSGVLGTVLSAAGLVQALAGAARALHVTGGAYVAAALLTAAALWITFKRPPAGGRAGSGTAPRGAGLAAAAAFLVMIGACAQAQPEPIALGKDACDQCRMTISDARFGGEAITTKGRILRFDSVECLAAWSRSGDLAAGAGVVAHGVARSHGEHSTRDQYARWPSASG